MRGLRRTVGSTGGFSSLAAAQAVDIERHGADIVLAQAFVPVGHHAEAGEVDRFMDRLAGSAGKPDRIRKLRRALRAVARSVFHVAAEQLSTNSC